jgi:hypothetical protein
LVGSGTDPDTDSDLDLDSVDLQKHTLTVYRAKYSHSQSYSV